MLFSLLKHYLDTALKVSQSVYCFTTSISHGVENYFPRPWGTGISDAIFSHFGPVLIYRKLDHPMAGIYVTGNLCNQALCVIIRCPS